MISRSIRSGTTRIPLFRKQRLQKLKKLLAEAETLGLIRPYAAVARILGEARRPDRGPGSLRSAGAAARCCTRARPPRRDRRFTDSIENDALYAQVREVRDEDKKP